MFTNKKSIFLICCVFLILISISFTFAIDNETVSVGEVKSSSEKVDIYFNSSADHDGDGSKENPYKQLTSKRIVDNSNIYLADGEYVLNTSYDYIDGNMHYWGDTALNFTSGYSFSLHGLKNVSFIGQSLDKTVIRGKNNCIWSFNNYLSLNNITFINNNFNVNNGTLIAKNIIFKDSTAYYCDGYGRYLGGVIATKKESNIEIYDSKFINISSQYGGAIYMNSGYLKIVNASFINSSSLSGASICCENNTRLNILKSRFINTSAECGGAIYMDGGYLIINYSSFKNTDSAFLGGALCCENNVDVSVSNSEFDNIKSINSDGGAIYVYCSSLEVVDSNFTNCFAGFGGGICTLNSTTDINKCYFKYNVGNYSAGAIYAAYGELNVSDSIFIDNSLNDASVVIDEVKVNLNSNNFTSNSTEILVYFAELNLKSNNGLNNENIIKINEISFNRNSSDYILFNFNLTEFDGELPSYYSLVDEGYVTSVKDQKNGGNCWSFTAMSVLESCILKLTNTSYDLSEQNLKNLMASYSKWGWNSLPNGGGKVGMTIGYLSSWFGPILDITDQYLDNNALSNVFDPIFHIDNIILIKRNNYTDNDDVKRAILTYGAVGGDLCYSDYFLNTKTNGYYCNDTYLSNHAITIVGWDDNYSKDNFLSTPEGDGAWIVKNSWGPDWGDNGYFYVSYYDRVVSTGDSSYLYTILLNNTRHYDKNYQYDAGFTSNLIFSTDSFTYKNIYNASDDECLAAVGTYFFNPVEWTISIYVNGEFMANKTGCSNAGYHTIDLDDLIKIKKGDLFEVQIKQNSSSGGVRIPIAENSDMNKNVARKGISYIYNGGKWVDMYDEHSVICIKALTITGLDATVQLTINENNLTAFVVDGEGNPLTSGNVTFIIDGVEGISSISEGFAILNHDFTHEESYKISATLNAEGYKSVTVNTTFHHIVDINISVGNAVYGNDIILNITLNRNLTLDGDVVVIINNKTYYITLSNQNILYNVSDILNVGKYDVNLTYIDCFNNICKNTSFNITKSINNINITVGEVTYPENALVIVKADVDGIYQIDINGTMVNVTVVNGQGSANVYLTVGEYVADCKWNNINYDVNIVNDAFKVIMPDITMDLNIEVDLNNVNIAVLMSKEINSTANINLSGKIYPIKLDKGIGILNLKDLAYGKYDVSAVLDDERYGIVKKSDNFTVDGFVPQITWNVKNITVGEVLDISIDLFTVCSIKPAGNLTVYIVDKFTQTNKISDGKAEVSINDLGYGNYTVYLKYSGDDYHIPIILNKTFTVLRINPSIIVSTSIGYGSNPHLTLSNGMTGNLIFDLDGTKYNFDITSYDCNLLFPTLSIGSHELNIIYNGDEKFSPLNMSQTIVVEKANAVLYANSLTLDVLSASKGFSYSVALKDGAGNVLSGKNINIVFDGRSYSGASDAFGVLNVVLYSSSSGLKNIVISFNGDSNYNSHSLTQSVNVMKVKTVLKTSKKTYKKKAKSKKIQATLKDNYGRAIKNAKVIFKVKSKKYSAKTNSRGIATVKVKLNKKGSYKVKVSFAGNNIYISSSKSTTLKIK